jgi:ATP-dependent protease ClpP protease subunit
MNHMYRMSDEPQDVFYEVNESEVMMNKNEQPSTGIEVEENHIYFYAAIGEKEALELVRIIRRMDIEMAYLASRIGLEKSPPIHLHIHSPGGDAFSGLNICDVIDNCKTDVYTYVEGFAASAATLISCRGTKRFITKRSFMLVHQPQILWAGKHDEFVDEIENQKNLFKTIKDVYLTSSKIDNDRLEDLLRHELYLTAEQCQDLGLVDEII